MAVCDENGAAIVYYRLNEACEACPCDGFSLSTMLGIAFVITVAALILLDHLMKGVDHLSTIFAPVMIVVTFFQTLGLLLDLKVMWPAALKEWMSLFNALNINIELAKPECSVPFGAYQKLLVAVLLPFFILTSLGLFAGIKLALAKVMYKTEEEFMRRHDGKNARSIISEQVLTIWVACCKLHCSHNR